MSSAVSLAIGAIIVGIISLFGAAVYAMLAANAIEHRAEEYAGDHDSFSDEQQ